MTAPSASPVKCATVILAAGKGTRMVSQLPKVMHKLVGEPMIAHVLRAASALSPEKQVVVIAPGMDTVREASAKIAPGAVFAVQQEQLGTGHAVRMAEKELAGFSGTVLVLFGDTPLITEQTLRRMLEAAEKSALVILGMRPADPTGYGRLVLDSGGTLQRIVECRDANAEEKLVTLCNSGVMAIEAAQLFPLLARLKTANAGGEYYLTDIVALARAQSLAACVVEAPAAELLGVNSRAQLAAAESAMQERLRTRAMAQGATLVAPETVFLCTDTKLGRDVVVQPHVIFGPQVAVGDETEIRSFSHLEGAMIGAGCIIGPFARLRPGTVLERDVHVGNFVELKASQVAEGAKINHLAYVGDTSIGAHANIGAGTITCNYDGAAKHRTVIGSGAFIGSNSSLVAPVEIGEGAVVGAGSVITQDVPAGALALGRAQQVIKENRSAPVNKTGAAS